MRGAEGAPLCRGATKGGVDGAPQRDILQSWAIDAKRPGGYIAPTRSYAALVPWDTLGCLAVCGMVAAWLAALLLDALRAPGDAQAVSKGVLLALPALLCGLVLQSPTRLHRERDALVFEFPLGRRTCVPLEDVLELTVVGGTWELLWLLQRWDVFPFGISLRFFCGLPSGRSTLCVLLTGRPFWSFAFCLEDLTSFLVDSQRPLDLSLGYRTNAKVLVRTGESFTSDEVGSVRPGVRVRLEQQLGHRVSVRFEDGTVGWMSYVSKSGQFLLVKDESSGGRACRGAVGCSELSRDYGALELGAVELPVEAIGRFHEE